MWSLKTPKTVRLKWREREELKWKAKRLKDGGGESDTWQSTVRYVFEMWDSSGVVGPCMLTHILLLTY